jgi:transposase-like protein
MAKNKKWDYETKVEIVKQLNDGRSYSSISKEYGVKSTGMLANWKRDYNNNELKDNKPGRPIKNEAEEYDILKKCYAQLMKIRSK